MLVNKLEGKITRIKRKTKKQTNKHKSVSTQSTQPNNTGKHLSEDKVNIFDLLYMENTWTISKG
jgi:hypothetical protein